MLAYFAKSLATVNI